MEDVTQPVDGASHPFPSGFFTDSQSGANAWLTMALREGKNREVRRVCEHLGLRVNRLIRTAYGPFQLGNLPPNAVEEVPRKALAEQLGERSGAVKSGTAKAKPRARRPGQGSAKPAHRRRPA